MLVNLVLKTLIQVQIQSRGGFWSQALFIASGWFGPLYTGINNYLCVIGSVCKECARRTIFACTFAFRKTHARLKVLLAFGKTIYLNTLRYPFQMAGSRLVFVFLSAECIIHC